MEPIRRIELVIDAVQESAVERLLTQCGISGYTLLRNVAGRGHRGKRDADGLTAAFTNVLFIIAAPPEAAERFANAIEPLLQQAGGMCLISEASWVNH
jgi:nitrogen regulatory protein PII